MRTLSASLCTLKQQVAALAGATHIVVGRAITKAVDPRQAFAEAVAQFIDD